MTCCGKQCCSKFLLEVWGMFKGGMLLFLFEVIGWFLFSYVEDGLNVSDCFVDLSKVADKHYPVIINETKRAEQFFAKLHQLTNQSLSINEATSMYRIFRHSFKVPQAKHLDKTLFAYNLCIKWYRFSVVTITTIGYGSITPRTDTGKLLVIPYALIGIPMMLAFLTYIGSLVSDWTDQIMMCMHRIIKGNRPIKYRSIKHCFYLFLAMWIVIVLSTMDFAFIPQVLKSWLDGIYFYFVTFTTIGFGDIVAPASEISYYGPKLFFGLSIISGFVDSFLNLSQKFEIGSGRCINCRYVEENGEAGNQVEQDVEDSHL